VPAQWIRRSRLAHAAVALLSVMLIAGCKVEAINAAANKTFVYCTIMADPPTVHDQRINGTGHYRCDYPGADSVTMTVSLQKQSASGKWVTVTSHTFSATKGNTTRDRTEETRSKSVSVACGTGKFRSAVHAVEKSKGKSDTVDDTSAWVPNPCHHL
jgi:hypothetical protein